MNEIYMQRCIDLAKLGMGDVSPNPMVGCVIVHEDTIIGEGYHRRIGEAHAEVNAIHDVIEKFSSNAPALLQNSTAYVSLEPCSHFGKTPPCADLLIQYKIKKVVIGSTDPFSQVNGKGIEKLIGAGIEIQTGILADECENLNRRFFTRIRQQRPYIILKWAQTANGFFAPKEGAQKWISGPLSKQVSHKWRGEEDAILIGKTTALVDNPQLTNRNAGGKSPIRIVIDRALAVPKTNLLLNGDAKTIIFNEVKTEIENNIHYVQMEDMQFYLAQKIAFQLYLMDIQSVIIEGGIKILNQFITSKLWDEARVFTSNFKWDDGIFAPTVSGSIVEQMLVGDDALTIYSVQDKL